MQIKGAIFSLLLPPNGLVTLAFLALLAAWLRPKWRGKAMTVSLLSLAGLLLIGSPAGSRFLMQWVEAHAGAPIDRDLAAKLMAAPDPPGAIVVLGGGSLYDDRERPDTSTLSPWALERAVSGARLARWTGLPVLASGGKPYRDAVPEAQIIARVMKDELGVPVRWVEDRSRDTADNAQFSVGMLNGDGVGHVMLVTQAFHMIRARRAFEAAGMRVTVAPHGFRVEQGRPQSLFGYPTAKSMQRAALACHELFGNLWYWMRRQLTS